MPNRLFQGIINQMREATDRTIGVVDEVSKNVHVILKLPVCADSGDRVALSRRVGARWRLIGFGIIQ